MPSSKDDKKAIYRLGRLAQIHSLKDVESNLQKEIKATSQNM